MKFSFAVNQIKAFKNIFVTLIIPFILFLANNYLQFIPKSWENPITLIILSWLSYSIKNYWENKEWSFSIQSPVEVKSPIKIIRPVTLQQQTINQIVDSSKSAPEIKNNSDIEGVQNVTL